jgi:hypothetical protein
MRTSYRFAATAPRAATAVTKTASPAGRSWPAPFAQRFAPRSSPTPSSARARTGSTATGRRSATALFLALAVLVVLLVVAAPARAHPRKPAWLPELWYRIGVCETGLNWRHHTRDYQGAFGFARSTWDGYKPKGYPAEAYQATPRQQLVVARNVARRVGLSAWGCYRHNSWVRAGRGR